MLKYFYYIHLGSLLIQVFSSHPSVCLNTHCKSSLDLMIFINKGGEKYEELDWSAGNISYVFAEMLVLLLWPCSHVVWCWIFLPALFIGKGCGYDRSEYKTQLLFFYNLTNLSNLFHGICGARRLQVVS